MGRFLFLLGVLCLLTACGRGPTAVESAEFAPYVTRFNNFSKEYGRDTSEDPDVAIMFDKLESDVVGACETGPFHGPRIYIDRAAWEGKGDEGREAILFHELGHCVLGRDHINTTLTVGRGGGMRTWKIPSSLMHLRGVAGSIYSERKDEYLRELFASK